MAITGGFGTTFDLKTGSSRRWYMRRDGVKRWADNDEPCEPTPPRATSDGPSPKEGGDNSNTGRD